MNDYGAADFFSSYWWLLFPLAFFVAGGWNSVMRYQRTKAKIDLIKTYAAAGKDAPADLIASLDRDDEDEEDWSGMGTSSSGSSGGGSAFLVVLFAGLAGVFAYAGYSEMLGRNEEFYFVAMILGVLSVAFLGASLFGGRRK